MGTVRSSFLCLSLPIQADLTDVFHPYLRLPGFGGMIAQVAALDLKSRGLAYSCHTFGSPAVFNQASVRRWNDLFHGDDSQRVVANEDSIPTAIGQGYNVTSGLTANYTFVDTGIHVFGTSSMYGQDFYVCVDAPIDPRCHGGNVESDHCES